MDVSTALTVLQTVMAQAEAAAAEPNLDMRMIARVAAAAFTIAIGVIGAAFTEGIATARACESIARNPQAGGAITRAMLIGLAITESTAIYALAIALLILLLPF